MRLEFVLCACESGRAESDAKLPVTVHLNHYSARTLDESVLVYDSISKCIYILPNIDNEVRGPRHVFVYGVYTLVPIVPRFLGWPLTPRHPCMFCRARGLCFGCQSPRQYGVHGNFFWSSVNIKNSLIIQLFGKQMHCIDSVPHRQGPLRNVPVAMTNHHHVEDSIEDNFSWHAGIQFTMWVVGHILVHDVASKYARLPLLPYGANGIVKLCNDIAGVQSAVCSKAHTMVTQLRHGARQRRCSVI